MMNEENKKLEQLMREYEVAPPSSGFEQRIISAVSSVEQKQSIWRWISEMLEEFRLPAPAFCLVLLLSVGFVAGVFTYNETDRDSDNVMEQLLYEGEEYL